MKLHRETLKKAEEISNEIVEPIFQEIIWEIKKNQNSFQTNASNI